MPFVTRLETLTNKHNGDMLPCCLQMLLPICVNQRRMPILMVNGQGRLVIECKELTAKSCPASRNRLCRGAVSAYGGLTALSGDSSSLLDHLHPIVCRYQNCTMTESPKTRAHKACDTCRLRKIKCRPCDDASATNICNPCFTGNLDCTYEMPVKRRGPPPKRLVDTSSQFVLCASKICSLGAVE